MAVGNLFLGTARRKVGDIVLMRRKGQQISRIRVNPSNPRTSRQNLQRMVFATLSVAASELKTIVDHSWRGVATGQDSTNRFIGINSAQMRALAAANRSAFLIKGAKAMPNLPLQLSSGGLGTLDYECYLDLSEKSTVELHAPASVVTSSITDEASYIAALASLGFSPGEQLSLVFVQHALNSDPIAQFGDAANYASNISLHRVVFRQASEVTYPTTLLTGSQFSPGIIDYERSSNWVNVVAVEVDGANVTFSAVNPLGYVCSSAAIIRSSYNSQTGKWDYSVSRLSLSDDVGVAYNTAPGLLVAESYGNASADSQSEYYLQQADGQGSAPSQTALEPRVVSVTASHLAEGWSFSNDVLRTGDMEAARPWANLDVAVANIPNGAAVRVESNNTGFEVATTAVASSAFTLAISDPPGGPTYQSGEVVISITGWTSYTLRIVVS